MNLLTICDNLDVNRGEYFSESQQSLLAKLQPNITYHQDLKTIDCRTSLDNYTHNFNGQPFLCIAYAHGSETSIVIEDENYIHFENAYLFNHSMFQFSKNRTFLKNLKNNILIYNKISIFYFYKNYKKIIKF